MAEPLAVGAEPCARACALAADDNVGRACRPLAPPPRAAAALNDGVVWAVRCGATGGGGDGEGKRGVCMC